MLNKALKAQYDQVPLGEELASCITDAASNDELIIRAIIEIAKRDKIILSYQNNGVIDADKVYGVTKEEIRQSIVTGEKVERKGSGKGEKVKTYPAIKKIDCVISYLMGATIVYYERTMNKQKRYMFTSRAIEVIRVLQNRGYLSIEEILKDTNEK